MTVGVPLAWRNLSESKTRFAISVGAVALAILLIMALDGIVAGSIRQVSVYIDETPFDLIVSQKGVKNLHMTTSFFRADLIRRLREVEGVKKVTPILYTTDYLVIGDNRSVAYVIGFREGEKGGPWVMDKGTDKLKKGEIIIDRNIAAKNDVSLGDKLTVFGSDFKIAGLTKGTVTIVNSIAFMRYDDFERLRGLRGVASYAFVEIKAGSSPEAVKDRIEKQTTGVSVQSKEAFADSERQVVSNMSADIMKIMNLIGFLIGMAALGLTIYTATLAKAREYGILKAVGSGNLRLFRVVFAQAAISTGAGMAAALTLVLLLKGALALMSSNILIVVGWDSVLRIGLVSVVTGIVASAIPILKIMRLNPADVYRR